MSDQAYTFEGHEIEYIEELGKIRAQMSELKKRETALRDTILGLMDGTSKGFAEDGKPVCTITEQHRRTVNSAKLEALFPEIHSQVIEEKTSKVLKLS